MTIHGQMEKLRQQIALARTNAAADDLIAAAKAKPAPDQAENLRKQLADASTEGPEDDETYEALKVSVGEITREGLGLLRMFEQGEITFKALDCAARSLVGYLRDVCGHHDIEIPEDSE